MYGDEAKRKEERLFFKKSLVYFDKVNKKNNKTMYTKL